MKKLLIIAAALATAGSAGAAVAPAFDPAAPETTIRYYGRDTIQEYVPISETVLLLRVRDGNKWYRASMPGCSGMYYALTGNASGLTIGPNRPDGDFGRDSLVQAAGTGFGTVLCQIGSVVESGPPVGKVKG